MRYVGSKGRLSGKLLPVIQSYITEDTKAYIEPFVGGANIIDKIKHDNKIGSDLQKYLIALLKYVQLDNIELPERIMAEEYINVRDNKEKYEDWYVGLVGFCSSYSAKFFGGYARNYHGDNTGDWSASAIKALKKQIPLLKDITFNHCSFLDYNNQDYQNCVFYCDIPYKNTNKYSTGNFPYDEFYEWVRMMSQNNVVLISEYNMPSDFNCIWETAYTSSLRNNNKQDKCNNIRVEKLFKYRT